jgi:hypothetical protein
MAKFSEWSPYDKYVQAGMVDGQFLNAGFTVLCAGPPRLANIGGTTATAAALASNKADQMVMPIGVVQNVNLSHNRTFNRIFEVGSERSYFLSGRTMGSLNIARVLYHGPSLLRMLYAYYEDAIPPTLVSSVFSNAGVSTVANPHDVIVPPGYENMFLNLASDLFNQPVGLLLYVRDSNLETYGAVYLESCYVPSHSWATDANSVIIQEAAGIQFERAVPVAVSALSLITGASGSALGIGS